MTNNKQLSVVDSIIEFCQKQMDNDSSIHKGVYLSIIKFCEEQAKEMEKDHIRSAYMDGQDDLLEHCCRQQEIHFNSLHYYQRTFKNTEQ